MKNSKYQLLLLAILIFVGLQVFKIEYKKYKYYQEGLKYNHWVHTKGTPWNQIWTYNRYLYKFENGQMTTDSTVLKYLDSKEVIEVIEVNE